MRDLRATQDSNPSARAWQVATSASGHRYLRALSGLAAALLLAVVSGCGGQSRWVHEKEETESLDPIKISELRPKRYCEIEMTVPPKSAEGSSQCYKGTVGEVTHDEVILKDVVEVSQVEYGVPRVVQPPIVKKHDTVHVPLTGVTEIWALREKETVAANPGGKPSEPAAIRLPSIEAHPADPQAGSSVSGTPRIASGASHFSSPAPATPLHFDPPAASGEHER